MIPTLDGAALVVTFVSTQTCHYQRCRGVTCPEAQGGGHPVLPPWL